MNAPAIAFAVSLISPAAAYADDDSVKAELQALRHELKELATRDQQQIEALQRQVRALSAKHTRTERANAALGEHTAPAAPVPVPVAPAPPAPPPAIAVLESPGNLPGRSAVPPYTGAGPGALCRIEVVCPFIFQRTGG